MGDEMLGSWRELATEVAPGAQPLQARVGATLGKATEARGGSGALRARRSRGALQGSLVLHTCGKGIRGTGVDG